MNRYVIVEHEEADRVAEDDDDPSLLQARKRKGCMCVDVDDAHPTRSPSRPASSRVQS